MSYAVISDVHANLEALEEVLGDIENRKIKNIIFLGDAVGYGPNPNECVEMLQNSCKIMLAGNHDCAVTGITKTDYFNDFARMAIEWTAAVMTEKNKNSLKKMPLLKVMKKENIFLVHSTPKEPDKWHYLLSLWDAETNFRHFEEKTCFLGHSHYPFIIERLPSGEMLTHKNVAGLGKTERYIINAGSVGQPRDGDPRACYAVASEERVEFVKIKYDIEKTQQKMRTAGLPLPLINRLSKGV